MSFNEGDRVEMIVNPRMVGTVTGDKDTVFEDFVCVRWDSGDFARVNPKYLQHVEPRDVLTDSERQALGAAYERALDAVDPIGFVTATNTPTDWQTRAEQAEAKVARVEAYRDRLESMTEADRHYAKGIQKALGISRA